MTDLTLYHSPGACSRVTLTALEEIGIEYSTRVVDISKGDHTSTEYLAINPKGKVPTLRIGERSLTENAAILYHLHQTYPHAKLIPREGIQIGVHQGLEDLVWCSSTLHTITRQVRMPTRYTSHSPEAVRANGIEKYAPILELLASRLSGERWWYGDAWSIVDVYLYWNYSTAANGGLEVLSRPALNDHAKRVLAWPSFARALQREHAGDIRSAITDLHDIRN